MFGDPLKWAELLEVELGGLEERTLKRAYASKIKAVDAATEPEAFQEIRTAYEGLRKFAVRTPGSQPPASPRGPEEPKPSDQAKAKRPKKSKGHRPSPSKPKSSGTEENPPREDPTPTTPPSAVDAQAVADEKRAAIALAGKVSLAMRNPWPEGQWKRIFDDPLMKNMAAATTIENAIASELLTYTSQPGKEFELPPGINGEALKLIDERFSWYSDVRRLKNKFGFSAPKLIKVLMTSDHRPIEVAWSMAQPARSRSALSELTFIERLDIVVLSKPWFWSSLIITFVCMMILDSILPYILP